MNDETTPVKPRMKITLDGERTAVSVEFLPESGASGALTLSLDQITKLIQGLGNARAAMVEGKDLPFPERAQIDAIFNTRWYIQPEPMTEGSALLFDHPNYGPVGFVLPRDQVAEVVRLLTNHLSIQPSAPGKTN